MESMFYKRPVNKRQSVLPRPEGRFGKADKISEKPKLTSSNALGVPVPAEFPETAEAGANLAA